MALDRRNFLKTVGVALGAAAGCKDAQASTHGHAPNPDGIGVLVDVGKCIGCRQCEYACKDTAAQASQAKGSEREAALFKPEELATFEDKSVFHDGKLRRPENHCYTTISRFERPGGGNPVYMKYNCLHCNDPACASACLVGAFHKLKNGAVIYDSYKCMGCRYCMVACPFGIPTYEYDNPLTPQVRKCTLCNDETNPVKGKVPACVKICPAEVMTYDTRENLLKLAKERIAADPNAYEDHIYGEEEVGGTAWIYLLPKGMKPEDVGLLSLPKEASPRRTESVQHGIFKYFLPPVMWFGLLGAAMWVSKPDHSAAPNAGEGEKSVH